uniref:C-reactive protein-like isoform X2 n=1 Tax=Scatophagus argus TaxID=75038 RepID=UPI001ED82F88|nr:C-reactive protein-like isoform X2 [Scatophagus argus]
MKEGTNQTTFISQIKGGQPTQTWGIHDKKLTQPELKMEKLLILMVMFATCSATPKDLSGKVFIFPRENNKDHVKLLTSQTEFNSVTTCLRHNNDFVLFKINSRDVIRMHARDGGTDFLSLSFSPNAWHSMCATWHSDTGLAQLWVDGKATIKRFIQTGNITGPPSTVLGQEQDGYGGGFDANQSFIGMITKVHMWDYLLPAAEIKHYMDNKHFTPGNVFNWRNLDFEIRGQVFVEEESDIM